MKALAILLLLAGCATAAPAPLPALVAYSRQDQAALLAEPKGPVTVRWLNDYIGLRDQVRAANAIRP